MSAHISHHMSMLGEGPEKVCAECSRCTCHRPEGLQFECPAAEQLRNLPLEELTHPSQNEN